MGGKLTLKERFVLLALDDAQGYIIHHNTAYWIGLAGAVLFEMLEKGLVMFDDHCINYLTPIADDPCHVRVLNLLKKHSQPPRVERVLEEMWDSIEDTQQEIINGLVNQGILKEVKKSLLWFIPIKRYPMVNKIPELRLRKYLMVLAQEDRVPDEESFLLFRLVYQCGLVAEVFGKKNQKVISEYIEELKEVNDASGKISESVKNIETALLTAIRNLNLQMVLSGG
ncbi:MAG: GPP34 family phosphoprotein [Salinivirgaceae bacterium]|nr:GPP34 family phosphoprotein [Salinivirgaceae bacterium]